MFDETTIRVAGNEDSIVATVDRAFEQGAVEIQVLDRKGFVFADPDIRVPEVMFNNGDAFDLAEDVDLDELEADIEQQLDYQGWYLWSKGMSNQDRYDGGWMHASEQLSKGMVKRMFDEPGIYALVFPPYSNGQEMDCWGIIKKKEID